MERSSALVLSAEPGSVTFYIPRVQDVSRFISRAYNYGLAHDCFFKIPFSVLEGLALCRRGSERYLLLLGGVRDVIKRYKYSPPEREHTGES